MDYRERAQDQMMEAAKDAAEQLTDKDAFWQIVQTAVDHHYDFSDGYDAATDEGFEEYSAVCDAVIGLMFLSSEEREIIRAHRDKKGE